MAAQQQRSASLYVGDLAPDVGEALLFEMFNVVGPVASIRVCRDSTTRLSLGYAYVNFHNMQDAERALDTMNFTQIKGKPCRIMWSRRDPSIRRSGVGNIFIKNLDTNIDNKSLYDTFSAFGNILSCKVMSNRGYGFVHYETAEAAEAAIEKLNGMLLNGKQVYVGHFVPRKDRQQGPRKFTNCYVKNIPLDWTDEKFTEYFGEAGEITSAVVMKNDQGASKGFGFVNYAEPEVAAAACERFSGEVLVEEKPLVMQRAMKKSEREKMLRNQQRNDKSRGVNLYIKNLHDSIDDEALRELFAEFGTITSCVVAKDPETGASKGFGFCCFAETEEATKAVAEMNTRLVQGKPLYVALAEKKEVRKRKLEAQHARQRQPAAMPNAAYPPNMYYGAPNAARGGFVYQQMPGVRGAAPRAWQGARGGPQQQQQMAQHYAMLQQQQAAVAPMSAAQPVLVAQQQPADPLTPSRLAQATPEVQKQLIGERLYPMIAQMQPELAGKITGMLLEMDNAELINLLESQPALAEKVNEAVEVLQDHQDHITKANE